jgi:hypothetical protein
MVWRSTSVFYLYSQIYVHVLRKVGVILTENTEVLRQFW